MYKEPYTDFQSLNWVQLTESEFLLVAVNYCFIDKSWIDRDLFDKGISSQGHSNLSSTDYVIQEIRVWRRDHSKFTKDDKILVETYLKDFEKQQRLKNWGK